MKTSDEPIPSLDDIEMEYHGPSTVIVTGYDEDGKLWKEVYKHDRSEVIAE